jgi:type III pantothenate kinase
MLYEGNIIVVDFGTAVTLNVVSRDGTFLGGTIMPGPALLLESLARGTARLPLIRHSSFTIRHSPPALGRDTRSAIRVGVLAQLSGGISASVEAIRASTHRRYRVVATGGAACLARHIPAIEQVEPHLAALGLARLYRVNRNDSRD